MKEEIEEYELYNYANLSFKIFVLKETKYMCYYKRKPSTTILGVTSAHALHKVKHNMPWTCLYLQLITKE